MAEDQPDQIKASAKDVTAGRNLGEEVDREEIQVQHPSGKVETKKVGDLKDSHGEAMDGPTSADLNPGFYPRASTQEGAQDK